MSDKQTTETAPSLETLIQEALLLAIKASDSSTDAKRVSEEASAFAYNAYCAISKVSGRISGGVLKNKN